MKVEWLCYLINKRQIDDKTFISKVAPFIFTIYENNTKDISCKFSEAEKIS